VFNLEDAISFTRKDEVCIKLGMPNEQGRKMPLVVEEDEYQAILLPITR
jgi:hypothetical protein